MLTTLFNSDTNISCADADFVKDIAIPTQLRTTRRLSTSADNHYIDVKEAVLFDFYINDIRLSDAFFIVQGLSEEVITGTPTLNKWRIKLDVENDKIIVDPKLARLQV